MAGLFILAILRKRMAKPNPSAAEKLKFVSKVGFQAASNVFCELVFINLFYFFCEDFIYS